MLAKFLCKMWGHLPIVYLWKYMNDRVVEEGRKCKFCKKIYEPD